jgi:predicted PurR-regulated permease PerM
VLERPLDALNSLRESIAGPSKDGGGMSIDLYAELVRPMLALLTPALGQIVIFFATLLFFLAGREPLRRRFLTFWADRKARLGALHFLGDTEASLASYFGVVTAINAGLGLVLFAFGYFYGLPNPVVWGILAFLLNYVPYIGAAVVILLLLGVSLVAFDSLTQAFVPPLFYLAVTTIEGQLITPGIVGLRLALNPLLVFLAVAFFTWFWGPFGALLAVPLLIIGNVALNHVYPKTAAKLPD